MADLAESSSMPPKDDKPVIVRVKRKATHSPLEAFWLEINERPLKRPLLDFGKLSISDSREKEELKAKKVFVQHVETISNPAVTVDVLQSFVPNVEEDAVAHRAKNEERRRPIKMDNPKQDQLLVKAKQKQELLSKNARFEQIWRSRKGKGGALHDEALHEMCHLYDVVRVDVEETTNQLKAQEDEDLEDHKIMASYLPLLREFIPSAAAEIESDIHSYMSKQASVDNYVYDLYAVKDDANMTEENAVNPFPLVQVDDDDGFYDGPDESEYESDDSNAEDNPLNDYPDEEASEDEEEVESRTSNDESEELDAASSNSSEHEDMVQHDRSGDGDPLYEGDIYGDDDGDCVVYGYDDDNDNGVDDDRRWSYR